MDSNVSNTTFFYKFIKLQLSHKNWTLENLLRQNLLRTIDLYIQKQNIDIDLSVIAKALEHKILLLRSSTRCFDNFSARINSQLPFTNFVYRCAIAFPLASYCGLSPADLAGELVENMPGMDSSLTDRDLELVIVAEDSGYLDFYLSELSVAIWLERSLLRLTALSTPPIYAPIAIEPTTSSYNLVPLQYVHHRCCSLLSLGEREGLIELQDPNFEYLIWHIARPKTINWLDRERRLWLSLPSERELLGQLLTVADASTKQFNWYKLALNLSQTMLVFDAECRITGEVKQNSPQKAIARLASIAFVQYWLQKLLIIIN
jgi:hypothetical protein